MSVRASGSKVFPSQSLSINVTASFGVMLGNTVLVGLFFDTKVVPKNPCR